MKFITNLKLILATLLVAFGASAWAQDSPEVTMDFTGATDWGIPNGGTNKDETAYTYGDYTIKLASTTNYKQNSGYVLLGKSGSYLELPAFSFAVEKIEVEGTSVASTSVKQNIYVGEVAVSTETTGAKDVTNIYVIADGYQAAGTVYRLVVNSNHNTQIASIKIYKKAEGGVTVAKPVFTPTGGSFIASQEVTITAEEGADIYYTVDGTTPTTESTKYTAAFAITETTTVKAIAVKGGVTSSEATATFTLIPSYSSISAVTALTNNDVFVFTGEALIVAKPTANHVYIQDETGSALLYDSTGEKTAAAEVGKTMAANWSGKVSIFKKLFEIVPDQAIAVKDGDAATVTYPEATAEDITLENVNKVVLLKGITSYSVDGKNLTITIGENEIAGYNQFGLEIAAAEDGKTYEMVGSISRYNDNAQFQPIEIKEAEEESAKLFADGKYYIQNVAAKKFMAAGASWGTHAVVDVFGLDYTLTFADGKYTIDSQVSNGGDKHFLNGEWNDGVAFNWIFDEVAEGVYTISDGTNFLTAGEDGIVTLAADATVDAAKWTLVNADEDFAAKLAAFETATAENGVDATFFIKGANFNRNDLRNAAWVAEKSGGNQTIAGPSENRTTFGCESWNNTFSVSQTITGLPDGVYEFSIAGYGTNGTTYVFANETEAVFVNQTAAANFKAALEAIAAGEYTGNTTGKVIVIGGTLKIGVKRTEQVGQDWAVFDNARLTYWGEIPSDEFKTAYEDALAAANAALANEDYASVTGAEKTALTKAIEDYATVEDNADAYKAATTALNTATAAFTAAKSDYDALAAAKASKAEFDLTAYAYAAEAKADAAKATLTAEATDAADAKAKTEAIDKAFRAVVESNALLEGVEGAVNMTTSIVNPNAAEAIAEPWAVVLGEGSGGSLNILDGEPLTDAEGNSAYKYFDGGNWGASAWDVSLVQTITLPAGKYYLSAAGRASADVTLTLFAGENKVQIPAIGNAGGLFGRGWNDASLEFEMAEEGEVKIGVQGVTEVVHNWMSFTRFRLMQFPADPEPEPIDPNLIEIAQDQGKDLDTFTRTEFVEGEDYNTYTCTEGIQVAFKMFDIDVKGCDYVVVKFAEPVEAGWELAFWGHNDNSTVAVPAGATEYKYVFADDPKCAIENDILPQLTMLHLWTGTTPLVAKVAGVYKHIAEVTSETYAVNVTYGNHGIAVADKAEAAEGETVTITVTPDAGYKVDEASFSWGDGQELEFSIISENQGQFTMPAGIVNISFTFKRNYGSYYIAGNMTDWAVTDAYKMSSNKEVTEEAEEYTFTMDLTTASQFKVVKVDGETQTWIPDGMGNAFGENGEIKADGKYIIRFRPNADGGDDWFEKMITIESAEDPVIANYEFVASEWIAGDPGRISADNVVVNDKANTITVDKAGNNNVALLYKGKDYIVSADNRYFVIKATGLSTEEGKSYLWWLNNKNNGSQIAPNTIYDEDGVTVFAWDLMQVAIAGTLGTEETLFTNGSDWSTTFGMTLADEAVPAVISYIGFQTSIPQPVEEYEYAFDATLWVAGDPGRISADNVVVDVVANTITVDKSGNNNIALVYRTDKMYYVEGADYFVIQGTGLSTEEGKSYLWWLNGANNGTQVAPTFTKVDENGLVTFAWDIAASGIGASFNAAKTYLVGGEGWNTTFGLTLADEAVPAVISYIGFDKSDSDIMTGINGIYAAFGNDGAIYDLAGRRVKNVVKGNLYIVNGKKVLVK